MPQQIFGTVAGKHKIAVLTHTTHALDTEPVELVAISRQVTHGEDPDITAYTHIDIYRADALPMIDDDLLPWRDYGDRVESDKALDIAMVIAAELQVRVYSHGAGRGWQTYATQWTNTMHLVIEIASGKDI